MPVLWIIALVQVNNRILQLSTLIMSKSIHQIQMTSYPRLMPSKVQVDLSHKVDTFASDALHFRWMLSNISFLSLRSRRLQTYDMTHHILIFLKPIFRPSLALFWKSFKVQMPFIVSLYIHIMWSPSSLKMSIESRNLFKCICFLKMASTLPVKLSY